MTDHTLARADEVLTELVELVETARTLPMSSSCVIPRERTLDLLDALREVMPPEMVQARNLVAQRDRLLSEAAERAEATRSEAAEQAELLLATARAEAHQLLEGARAEQAQLVSAASVQQAATAEAASLRAEAEEYAARLAADARSYATATLAELVQTLQQLLSTAENGRDALAPPPGG
jgi:regulator of protease activity HflC (stomatin/prohibitin superfamily)